MWTMTHSAHRILCEVLPSISIDSCGKDNKLFLLDWWQIFLNVFVIDNIKPCETIFDIVFRGFHSMVMIEWSPGRLCVRSINNLNMFVIQALWHLIERLNLRKLLKVVRIVNGIITNTHISVIVKPTQRIAIKYRSSWKPMNVWRNWDMISINPDRWRFVI